MHPGAADRAVSIWWLRSNDQSELKYASMCRARDGLVSGQDRLA
jgi:hypothetical protein